MVTVDVEIGESWDVEWYFQIVLTIAATALTGQRQASCEHIRVTVFIFLSFFCRSKVRAMQSANSSSLWLWSSCLAPLRNWIEVFTGTHGKEYSDLADDGNGYCFLVLFSGSVFLNSPNSFCWMNADCPSLSRDGFGYPFSQKVTHHTARNCWLCLQSIVAMDKVPMMMCLCSVFSYEIFAEEIVLDPNQLVVFHPSLPCPILLLVCSSLNCALTGNLSSNAVSNEVVSFGNCQISKWEGTCEGQKDLMTLVISSSLLLS